MLLEDYSRANTVSLYTDWQGEILSLFSEKVPHVSFKFSAKIHGLIPLFQVVPNPSDRVRVAGKDH